MKEKCMKPILLQQNRILMMKCLYLTEIVMQIA